MAWNTRGQKWQRIKAGKKLSVRERIALKKQRQAQEKLVSSPSNAGNRSSRTGGGRLNPRKSRFGNADPVKNAKKNPHVKGTGGISQREEYRGARLIDDDLENSDDGATRLRLISETRHLLNVTLWKQRPSKLKLARAGPQARVLQARPKISLHNCIDFKSNSCSCWLDNLPLQNDSTILTKMKCCQDPDDIFALTKNIDPKIA